MKRRKQSAGPIFEKPAPGYGDELKICYVNTRANITTIDFGVFTGLGPIVNDLVASVNRWAVDKRPGSIQNAWHIVLSVFKDFRGCRFRDISLEHINGQLLVASALRSGTLAPQTVYRRYHFLRSMCEDAARWRGLKINLGLPEDKCLFRGQPKPTKVLNDDDLQRIIEAACDEVRSCWDEYDGSHPASSRSLIPFLILLIYALTGNASAVLEMERDCMVSTEADDVLRGKRKMVRFTKYRSLRELGQTFPDNNGPFSVPTLIRRILAMTEPLLPQVAEEFRNRLFIGYYLGRHPSLCKVKHINLKSTVKDIHRFCLQHDLRSVDGTPLLFSLNMLRTTKINRTYIKTGDIILTNKIANHKNLSTTVRYLNHRAAFTRDRSLIADIQGEIVRGGLQPRLEEQVPITTDERACAAERDCADPYRTNLATDRGSLCKDWAYPLNDPGMIIPNNPRFLAAVLRDYNELLETRLRINEERFHKLYEPKLVIIEKQIIPKFDESMMSEARLMIATLPKAMRLQ